MHLPRTRIDGGRVGGKGGMNVTVKKAVVLARTTPIIAMLTLRAMRMRFIDFDGLPSPTYWCDEVDMTWCGCASVSFR